MSAFADSSALVKLYADEAGSADVRSHATLIVSALARVEVPAALWRKARTGALDAADAALLTRAFHTDRTGVGDRPPRFSAVSMTSEVLDRAARLVAVHPLRAHDAVQLASAIAAREADPACTRMLVMDHQLTRAATAEGFEP